MENNNWMQQSPNVDTFGVIKTDSEVADTLITPDQNNTAGDWMQALKESVEDDDDEDSTLKVCMLNNFGDPRHWDNLFEKWKKDPEMYQKPGKHPWPDHPYNLYPEIYDISYHLEYKK